MEIYGANNLGVMNSRFIGSTSHPIIYSIDLNIGSYLNQLCYIGDTLHTNVYSDEEDWKVTILPIQLLELFNNFKDIVCENTFDSGIIDINNIRCNCPYKIKDDSIGGMNCIFYDIDNVTPFNSGKQIKDYDEPIVDLDWDMSFNYTKYQHHHGYRDHDIMRNKARYAYQYKREFYNKVKDKHIKSFPIIRLINTNNLDTGVVKNLRHGDTNIINAQVESIIQYLKAPNLSTISNNEFNFKIKLLVSYMSFDEMLTGFLNDK